MVRSERVKQGRLPMIYMAHDGYNWRAPNILAPHELVLILGIDHDYIPVEFHADKLNRLVRENLEFVRVYLIGHILYDFKHFQRIFTK